MHFLLREAAISRFQVYKIVWCNQFHPIGMELAQGFALWFARDQGTFETSSTPLECTLKGGSGSTCESSQKFHHGNLGGG